MAMTKQLECHPVVGCVSSKSSSEMIAQCLTSPASRHTKAMGVGAIILAILDTVAKSYKRYQSRVALHRLSDEQLCDIGLERTRDGIVSRERYRI